MRRLRRGRLRGGLVEKIKREDWVRKLNEKTDGNIEGKRLVGRLVGILVGILRGELMG